MKDLVLAWAHHAQVSQTELQMAIETKARAIVTVAGIAAMSGVSDMTIRRWRRTPGFPKPLYPPSLSRTLLFDRLEVERWLNAQREGRVL